MCVCTNVFCLLLLFCAPFRIRNSMYTTSTTGCLRVSARSAAALVPCSSDVFLFYFSDSKSFYLVFRRFAVR